MSLNTNSSPQQRRAILTPTQQASLWILAAGNLLLAALLGSDLFNENWLGYPIGAQNCGWAYQKTT
jgi:hypothetical protein